MNYIPKAPVITLHYIKRLSIRRSAIIKDSDYKWRFITKKKLRFILETPSFVARYAITSQNFYSNKLSVRRCTAVYLSCPSLSQQFR